MVVQGESVRIALARNWPKITCDYASELWDEEREAQAHLRFLNERKQQIDRMKDIVGSRHALPPLSDANAALGAGAAAAAARHACAGRVHARALTVRMMLSVCVCTTPQCVCLPRSPGRRRGG